MNLLRSLMPIIRKEFRQVRRDPTSLGMLLVLPAVLIILVGYALNFDVKHIPLAVYDQSKTPESRAYLQIFKASEYFSYRYDLNTYNEVDQEFLNDRIKIVLVIPRTFATDLTGGSGANVQILLDGSDANTAGQAVSYAARMTMEYSSKILISGMQRVGRAPYIPIEFVPRIWFNPDLVTSKFLIPGLIGLIIVLTAVVSTAMAVVREKERGTMEQIMVSPLKPVHVILGKTVPYFIISLGAATSILILGYFLFDVTIRGSILVLYLAIGTIILGALGQGLLISTITDSQQVAFMLAIFSSLLPSFLLSGFVFPISNMPVFLQIVSNIAVNKFFLVVVRGVMLRGVGLGVLWPQFAYMGLFAALTLGLSMKRMQKRVR
jgi:ABC-2 type transport system permease protein